LFMGENDGPCFSVFDDADPKDELVLSKVRHAELFLNDPHCRLDPLYGVRDDGNAIHIHHNDSDAMHEMVHGVEVGIGGCSLEPKG
jgi:hypothetical protein